MKTKSKKVIDFEINQTNETIVSKNSEGIYMITVIGNMKGGTGKSTLTFNLAVWYAWQEKSLCLLDLDPQKTFLDVVEVRQEEGYEPGLPLPLGKEALEVLPKNVAEILIDVSMTDEVSLEKAIKLADRVIVPVAPSQADIWSTQRFLKKIDTLCTDSLPEILAVLNRADTHPFVPETKEAEEALDALSVKRLPVRLYNRAAYRRSFSEGLGVFELEQKSKAAQEFKKLAQLL